MNELIRKMMSAPCVKSRQVIIDVRGVYPIAISSRNRMYASEIHSFQDFAMFIVMVL